MNFYELHNKKDDGRVPNGFRISLIALKKIIFKLHIDNKYVE